MTDELSLRERILARGLRESGTWLSLLAGNAHRFTGLPSKGRVRVVSDVPYAPRGRKQAVDFYLPEKPLEPGRPHPFLFFTHGGGWISGDRKMGNVIGRLLAARGIAVASAGYRLAPGYSLAQQLEDLHAAVRLVHERVRDYELDSERFALAGESAGGHLTLRLAQTFPNELPAPRGVIGIYGLYDFKSWSKTESPIAKVFLKAIRRGEPLEDFAEKHNAHRELPWTHVPVLLLHGERDTLVPVAQSHKLAKLLESQGVRVTVKTFPGREHAFNYSGRGEGREHSKAFYGAIGKFLTEHVI